MEIETQKNMDLKNVNVNNNQFVNEPELLTPDEKRQILDWNQAKIQSFISGRKFSTLTRIQKDNFARILGRSIYYMRLESEGYSEQDLYQLMLRDEIDKIFEPTNNEIAMLKEMYGNNYNNPNKCN